MALYDVAHMLHRPVEELAGMSVTSLRRWIAWSRIRAQTDR
jgi:hypothetical protein